MAIKVQEKREEDENCLEQTTLSKNKKTKKKSIMQKINNKINSIWFVVLLGIFIFLKTLFFYNNTIAINDKLQMQTIIGTFSFIMIAICFLFILPNRARIISGILINFFISILLFSDNLYYIYSNSVLSVTQITNLQYGEEIISTLPMVLDLKHILYFLDLIILIILFSTTNIKLNKKDKKIRKQLFTKVSIGIVGIVLFCIISAKYVEKSKDKSYNKDFQIKESTIFGYHIYDIESTINIKKKTKYKNYESMMEDYKKLQEEYQERYGQEKYCFKGMAKDKNIIILQLESIQEFVINKEINGKQITPNLNKFLNENIEMTNMHMQSYSTTADSEHSTITSLYPMENGMSFSRYYTNTYDDLFNMFNKENYHTSYMHGNDANFWNRGNVYSKLGVNDLALKDKFDDTEYINGFMSDELLYRQGVQKLKQYNNPFLSFVVSASSHTPYELEGLKDRSKVKIDVGKYKNTYFGNYLEAVNYADYTFGVFIEELKEAGLYEDTVILVFGDHNGLNMYNEEMIDFLKTINQDITDIDIRLNYSRVVCGLKLPVISHIKIEKPVSKLDIKPTLAYLCDIEDGFSLGTNMFGSKEFVLLNNERIIGSNYYYDESWYDISTGELVDMELENQDVKELLDRYYNNMKLELEISNSVGINNLLKNREDL